MDKIDIGRKIKELRKAKGFTQAQLAESVGMHEKHISRVESGRYVPSFDNMVRIFRVLDFDIADLVRGAEFELVQNPVKARILRIINNSTESELNFYLGLLEQVSKGLKVFSGN